MLKAEPVRHLAELTVLLHGCQNQVAMILSDKYDCAFNALEMQALSRFSGNPFNFQLH